MSSQSPSQDMHLHIHTPWASGEWGKEGSKLTPYDYKSGEILHKHLGTAAGLDSLPVSLWEKVTPVSQNPMWSRYLGDLQSSSRGGMDGLSLGK